MGDAVKEILSRPIQLADRVTKAADEATYLKQECCELKSRTEKLAGLLRQAARASADLYERPTRRIVGEAEQTLEKALSLVLRCRSNTLLQRVFTIMPIASAAFRKMSIHLDNSVADVTWLLRVGDGDLGLPPIAVNEPYLRFIWEPIAVLHTGSLDDRSDAAASLVSLARDNDRNCKLIVEEDGVAPLLKLLKEGKEEGQENAARAVGLLARHPESVEHMVHAGVCSVFSKILKQAPMRVQAVVAWAVAELVASYSKCQDLFAQHNVVRLLVSHLAFETIQEHRKYAIPSKTTSIHTVVVMASNAISGSAAFSEEIRRGASLPIKNPNQMQNLVNDPTGSMKLSQENPTRLNYHSRENQVNPGATSMKRRENEDPATKMHMKAMAARALWHLAKDNPATCQIITESRALLCLAVLIEEGRDDIQLNCAMALMEITAVAEQEAALRRSAFKPNSPACKAVVGQLLRIVENGESHLLMPCIKAIGNLARTFRATETRMIGPLVRLLDEREPEVCMESAIALSKFACTDNYLHDDHSKAIVASGGARHLVQLVYFEHQVVQIPAIVLLCYISIHVPDDEELAHAEALTVLEWASKQNRLIQDEHVNHLLHHAKSRLELYQSRPFH